MNYLDHVYDTTDMTDQMLVCIILVGIENKWNSTFKHASTAAIPDPQQNRTKECTNQGTLIVQEDYLLLSELYM